MELQRDHTSLVEFMFQEKTDTTLKEKIQLVRILSRSSTLPKVEGIYINVLAPKSNGFFIEPGRSIGIDKELLSSPAAALLCLRYALEWQIWYKSQDKNSVDSRICDIAACSAAAKFYELTPAEDKRAINLIPKKLADILFGILSEKKTGMILSDNEFETLSSFHNKKYLKTDLDEKYIEILQHLANPLEYLLRSGGDVRLNVDPDQLLNVYGCRPFPRPEAFTFASSTATSISNVAYNQSETQRELLIRQSFKKGFFDTTSEFSEKIKDRLKENLMLPKSSTLILSPSGTDVTLQVAGICQAVFDKKIVHILMASDETGSGVSFALQGKHFSGSTSRGICVKKTGPITGFRKVEVKNIKLRDDNGVLKQMEKLDREATRVVKEAIEKGKQPVLHVMDQSKLGYSSPSDHCLQQLQKEFGEKILVLIDNSQLRMDQKNIQNYIEKGYLMTITGSKFFTGPPFNGALIIPKKINEIWKASENKLPMGLSQYFFKNEWPKTWKMTTNLTNGVNLGISMRWYASLVEIERYFNTPLSLRYLGLEMFCDHVGKAIGQSPFLEHLSELTKAPNNNLEMVDMKERRTIFPFFIKMGEKVLGRHEIDKLYRLLNQNISREFHFESDESQDIAGQICHIGQPVKTIYKDGTPTGVVRISLGSRIISESWKDQDVSVFFHKIKEQMIQVNIIIRKIEFILNHPEWLAE